MNSFQWHSYPGNYNGQCHSILNQFLLAVYLSLIFLVFWWQENDSQLTAGLCCQKTTVPGQLLRFRFMWGFCGITMTRTFTLIIIKIIPKVNIFTTYIPPISLVSLLFHHRIFNFIHDFWNFPLTGLGIIWVSHVFKME